MLDALHVTRWLALGQAHHLGPRTYHLRCLAVSRGRTCPQRLTFFFPLPLQRSYHLLGSHLAWRNRARVAHLLYLLVTLIVCNARYLCLLLRHRTTLDHPRHRLKMLILQLHIQKLRVTYLNYLLVNIRVVVVILWWVLRKRTRAQITGLSVEWWVTTDVLLRHRVNLKLLLLIGDWLFARCRWIIQNRHLFILPNLLFIATRKRQMLVTIALRIIIVLWTCFDLMCQVSQIIWSL